MIILCFEMDSEKKTITKRFNWNKFHTEHTGGSMWCWCSPSPIGPHHDAYEVVVSFVGEMTS
jgi:hypothetical protein